MGTGLQSEHACHKAYKVLVHNFRSIKRRFTILPHSTTCIVSLENGHLNSSSQKMASSDHSTDTSPNDSNSDRITHDDFHRNEKKQRDNLRLFLHLWPLQTTIWANISQCLPENPAENQILGILVILIVDCDIGGSPLGN